MLNSTVEQVEKQEKAIYSQLRTGGITTDMGVRGSCWGIIGSGRLVVLDAELEKYG